MTDKIRAVRQQAPTSGTQDYTVSGFGTVNAAIVFAHVSGDDSDTDDQAVCVGFWDGATNNNQLSQQCVINHGSTVSEYGRWSSSSIVWMASSSGSVLQRSATISSITDGVRLTWNTQSAWQPYVTVLLVQCLKAKAGLTTIGADGVGTKDITGVADSGNFTPNFIFASGSYHVAIDAHNQPRQSFGLGFAADTGAGINNYSSMHCSRDQDGTSSIVSTTRSIGAVREADIAIRTYVTAMASGQFTIADPDGTVAEQQSYFGYLACEFTDVPELFTAATPTSGSWDFGGQSKKRQSFLIMTTACDGLNALDATGTAASNAGYYFVSEDEEYGFSTVSEDAANPCNTSGRHVSGMIIQGSTAGVPIFKMSSPTFDATGLVVTPTTFDATPRYVVGVGVGTGSTTTSGFSDGINRGTGRGIARGVG